MVSQRFQRTLKCRNIRNIKLKKIKHLRKIKWPYYICIYLSTICKTVLYSVPLYRFHDGVSTYMLLSYVLFTILHFPSDKQLIILQDFLSILYRFTKYFFFNLLKLEKQLYVHQILTLCLNESILRLDKDNTLLYFKATTQKSDWHFQSLGRDQHLCLSHTVSMSELAWIISWTWILSFIPTILPSLMTRKNKLLLHNCIQYF